MIEVEYLSNNIIHTEPSADTLFWKEYQEKQSKQILEDCEGYSSEMILWTND